MILFNTHLHINVIRPYLLIYVLIYNYNYNCNNEKRKKQVSIVPHYSIIEQLDNHKGFWL